MDQPQGNDAPEASQGQDPPQSITLEDVNRAITGRLREYEKKLDTKLTDSFSSFENKLAEIIEAKPVDKPAGDESSSSPATIEDSPKFRGQQKKLSELENRLTAVLAERDAEKQKSKDATLRQRLSDALAESGIEGSRAKHATGFLIDAEKRVAFDDNDEIVFRDGDGELLDLKTGMKAWLQSEDAKLYMPPRGVSGSGDRPTTNAARNGAPVDPREIANVALERAFYGD